MNLQKVKEHLENNGFLVTIFETKEEAAEYLNKEIDDTTVGVGGSVSLEEMNMISRLETHNTVYHHRCMEDMEKALMLSMNTEIYLMSANAIAADTGAILNIDGTGNRVSSSLFGHRKVYMIAGKNKISPDYESAIHRLRNVVAPKNAQRLGRKTPCALNADCCYDCNSPERICGALTVQYRKMHSFETEILLVNEHLGY